MRTPLKKKHVGLVGADGRMGREIRALLKRHRHLVLTTTPNRHGGWDDEAEDVDVWIDFSSPQGLEKVLAFAVANKQAVVSGTTGLKPASRAMLAKAARKIPILWASNMSLGVAVLREALTAFRALEGFDIRIEETHHRLKKDAPSGTALTLQEDLQGLLGHRLPKPESFRTGEVAGIHKVVAASDEEVLTFEHRALNRAVFARGALQAAQWISDRPPGLYSMRDILMPSSF